MIIPFNQMSHFKNTKMNIFGLTIAILLVTTVIGFNQISPAASQLSGAVFTTESACLGVDENIFALKDDVYLDGGSNSPNAGSGLPDGYYAVKVTEPNGTLLGTTAGSGDETPVHVTNGNFDICYQLSAILIKASDQSPGYDTTSNNGGEYKVWVSPDTNFDRNNSKTDNFKVKEEQQKSASITICKDAIPDDEQDFSFVATGNEVSNFVIDDDGDINDEPENDLLPPCQGFIVLPDTTYTFTENHVDNWHNVDIVCDSSNATTDVDNKKVEVTPDAEEDITCTFVNQGKGKIIIKKIALDGDGVFDFEIKDGVTIPVTIDTKVGPNPVFTHVKAGEYYAVIEGDLPDWFKFHSVSCVDKEGNHVGDPIFQGKENIYVGPGDEITCEFKNQGKGKIGVYKFYDKNVNGQFDEGDEQLIYLWKIAIDGDPHLTFFLAHVLPGIDHQVKEFLPVEKNWINTTPTEVTVNVKFGERKDVKFGNVCLGKGGGKTLGFWSNKNGAALITVNPDLNFLTSLNLRDGAGNDFNPTSYSQFRTWILGAKATNMAYMLSAQFAAMQLNVLNGLVNGNALIYAPGTTSANAQGFATVNAVLAEANTSLGANGLTLAGHPERAHQAALKDALDNANNNLNFLQGSACPFTFTSPWQELDK
jgi:hypothetical protein